MSETREFSVEEHTMDYGQGPRTSLLVWELPSHIGCAWYGEPPQLKLAHKQIRIRFDEAGQGSVLVGEMMCGTLQRLPVDGISLGGKVFPLKQFRDGDLDDSGFLSTLSHIDEQGCLYLVAGRIFVKSILKALSLHLSLVKIDWNTGPYPVYIWPTGERMDAQ